jgi:uncharacterized protein (TIGR02217 family)
MNFHEIRFPTNLSFGSVGGPERRSEIVTLANGHEERNSPWAHSRRRYDAGLGLRSLEDIETLIAFFEARRGQIYGFRWKDWSDYKSCPASRAPGPDDQLIGIGNGTAKVFSLRKTYVSGQQSYERPIVKPVAGTIRVAVAGVPKVESTDFVVDVTTGSITLTVAPGVGARVTAGYEFDVPVRFDTDGIQTSAAAFQAGDVPSVPILEVRL